MRTLLCNRPRHALGPDADSDVRFDDRCTAVRTVDLLALDDFGAQSDTPGAWEKFYQLVN